MGKVIIYTDGACSGNPGPGGWGAVLIYGDKQKEISGFHPATTNNRMEMTAVIEALKALNRPCEVDLFSDSAYVVNAFKQDWLGKWQQKGWVNSKKEPVENKDLWLEMLSLTEKHKVNWFKVKGHSDNELNNRCDELARSEIKKNV